MSTDSYGHGPQGSTADPVPWRSDPDPAHPGPPPPVHAGARRRPRPDGGGLRPKAPPRHRRKARRVHRVVHHLDIWSLAKVASVFTLCTYVIVLVSGFILWRAADRVGTIDGIEGFMEDTGGYDMFVLRGSVVFTSALLIGAVLGVLTVCLIVLAGILFNLISDLTGGIRMTVIDEDLIVTPARRGSRSQAPPPPAGAYPPTPAGVGQSHSDPTLTGTSATPNSNAPTLTDGVDAEVPRAGERDSGADTERLPAPPPSVDIDFG